MHHKNVLIGLWHGKDVTTLFLFLATILLVCALLCSCTTGTDISKKNSDGSPIWIAEVPKSSEYLYGVGKAKLTIDSNSQQAADAAARSDLALKINVSIDNALAIYSNETSATVVSAYEALIMQSVNLAMRKVVVEERWTAKDGTVWSLVSFRVKNLPEIYADAANDYLNQLEERRLSTEAKLVVLLEELKHSTDGYSVELKIIAQEKADSIVSEIEEITEEMGDIASQVNTLEDFLVKEGFEILD